MSLDVLIPIGVVILCLAGAAALGVMAYLLWYVLKMLRTMMPRIIRLMNDVQDMLTTAKPVVGKIDPLMDRATLTIDAVNLEVMRVDQIMEDISEITGSISKASSSIDTVTSKPLGLVSKATEKLRKKISPLTSVEGGNSQIVDAVDTGLYTVGEKVADMQLVNAERKIASDEVKAARDAVQTRTNDTAAGWKEAVVNQVNADTMRI